MLALLQDSLILLIGSIGAITFAYFQGKHSTKHEQNEELSRQVKRHNQHKRNVDNLTHHELDTELQKWRQ